MKRFIKFNLVILLILFSINSNAQKKHTGYFCTGANKFSEFKYTREYSEKQDTFITVYKIYNESYGHYLNITATHLKKEKKITVSIDDVTVPNGHIYTHLLLYKEASMEIMGRMGEFKRTFDKQNLLPNEIAVYFVSPKFENIKVMHAMKDLGINSTKWYILDEEN